jgi:hypothetical protein
MIWNSRKPIEKEIGGVKWTIKPFTAVQQAEFLDKISAMPDTAKERVERIYEIFEWLLETAVKDIKGLNDENGNGVDFSSVSKKELAEGFSIKDYTNVCDALAEINTASDSVKKKSLPQAESGTDA